MARTGVGGGRVAVKYFFSMFQTNRRVALYLMEKGRRELSEPRDMLLLLRLVDMAGHTSMRESELAEDHLEADEEELDRFGGVVSEAYRSVDRLLGELLEAFGEGNVVVTSDHGLRYSCRSTVAGSTREARRAGT